MKTGGRIGTGGCGSRSRWQTRWPEHPDPGVDWPGIVCGWCICRGRCDLLGRIIRKNGLIERNVARDKDTTRSKVKAPVALMFSRVTKENAVCRARLQLVVCGGIKVWEA
jgi:hypothetical protein